MSDARRRVHRIIREIGKLPPDEKVWILIYLLSGQKPPISEATFDRDQLIKNYLLARYADLQPDTAARAIASDLARYAASAWRTDQFRRTSADDRNRDLFEILKAGKLVGFETIRKIPQAKR
jgi:hypothetical protein